MLPIPWMVAMALQQAGWYLRDAVVWKKSNPMPGSQRDRCTSSYEFIFQLTKSARYFFDMEAIKEPITESSRSRLAQDVDQQTGSTRAHDGKKANGNMKAAGCETRMPRNVWTIPTQSFKGAHFATFPVAIPLRCIKASTSEKGCCPECGAPWVRLVVRERRATRPGNDNCSDETGKANRDEQRHVTDTKTVGWEPGCKCDTEDDMGVPFEPVPCVVLDPFAGSGTTLQAATLLGRRSTGCELSEEYAALAVTRINSPLEKSPGQAESLPGQLELF